MQYINSNLGIPIKPSFADMMSINRYSNATGDSVSSLQSQIRKIESELSSLDVKMQKEQLKKNTNQQKEIDAYKKTTILGGFKYRQALKDYNEARKAIKEANVEMGIIQNKMASLSIDLNQLQSQLVAAGGAPAPASAPRPLPPSAPPIAPPMNFGPTPVDGPTGGGIGGGSLLDGPTGSGGSADTGKSKINYPIVVIGSALVLGVLYFAVVK
jgi:hypothetical protein